MWDIVGAASFRDERVAAVALPAAEIHSRKTVATAPGAAASSAGVAKLLACSAQKASQLCQYIINIFVEMPTRPFAGVEA